MFKNLDPSALGVAGHQSEIIELALTFGFRGIDLDIVEFAGRMKVHGPAVCPTADRQRQNSCRDISLPVRLGRQRRSLPKRAGKTSGVRPMGGRAGMHAMPLFREPGGG